MKKSIAIAIGGLIVLGAIAAYFFFKTGSNAAPAKTSPSATAPFGSSAGYETGTGGTPGSPNGATTTAGMISASKLFELSASPVAGMTTLVKNNEDTVRYVDRASGHIYDISLLTAQKQEISDNTMTKVYEAVWSPDASSVVLRTLPGDGDTISNLSLALTPPRATTTPLYRTSVVPLGGGFADLLATSDGRLAYVAVSAPSIGISNFDGSRPATLLSTEFTDWKLIGSNKSSITIETKGSAGLDGFVYNLSRTGGALSKLLGPLPGLLAVPNGDLSRLAYSTSDGTQVTLQAMVLKTGTTQALAPATLADKCVWSIRVPANLYCASPTDGAGTGEPDAWYAGEAHFKDRIWLFNTDSGAASELADPSQDVHVDIDGAHLMLTADEHYLVFLNKTDLSLWALRLD